MGYRSDIDALQSTSAVAVHEAKADPHPQYKLPVGSIFLTAINTNPHTLLGYGTWNLIATNQILKGA